MTAKLTGFEQEWQRESKLVSLARERERDRLMREIFSLIRTSADGHQEALRCAHAKDSALDLARHQGAVVALARLKTDIVSLFSDPPAELDR